jgi:2-oxoglutarate/2-oxoacid ferredoxin oxidoreductase subunit beta
MVVTIVNPENLVYARPKGFTDTPTHYCPGCTHGTAHRLVAEVLEEMNLLDKAIGVAPVGCAVFAYNYINTDFVEAAHGRAPAIATGYKRCRPDKFVFTYQGDGDLASIGLAEIMHCANRGENLTTVFVNNGIYGMTGGQMAPTTLPGMKTTSSPNGRDVETQGYPIRMSEMLATLDGAGYIVRRSLHDSKNIRLAKKAIRLAFETQVHGLGFSMVELLSTCNTGWSLTPVESLAWLEEHMIPAFPLGDYKIAPSVAALKI